MGADRGAGRGGGETAILAFYNTLTRRREPFQPLEPGRVRMYVCGPNLYEPVHVGHAFSYTFFDVVRRYLEYRGYRVHHVQNFTDIEDRIIERSVREGRGVTAIAQEYIGGFFRDMDVLGVRRAHEYPRASEVIPAITEIVQGLIAKGHAYTVDGDVYFRVASFPRYLQLSHRTREEMQAGARVEVDPRKERPEDFALWKAAKPGEPSWPSPWGPGRPGWHIECSAMNLRYLGPQIDIHGGGADLVFPHHENEIAQSEAFTGRHPFARYWLHHALMQSPGGEEMHRHLRNYVSVQEALARYPSDAIRLFLLGTHYRSPFRWQEEAVEAAVRGLERLRTALVNAGDAIMRSSDQADGGLAAAADRARETFERAMDDDFNTPQALAALFTLAGEINRVADGVLKGAGGGGQGLEQATGMLRTLAGVLGLTLETERVPVGVAEELRTLLTELRSQHPDLFSDGTADAGRTAPPEADAVLHALLAARQRARERRAYHVSDRIRSRLSELGIAVEDLPGEARWRLVRR